MDWGDHLDIDDWDLYSTEEKLKALWEHDTDFFGKRFDEWPPTDVHGNEFPLEWIPVDELDKSGMLTDDHSRQFKPFAGNLEPSEGRCNVRLTDWEDRYPEVRYCWLKYPHQSNFCTVHKHREKLQMRAKEALQSGLSAKTRDHLYAKLDGWQKLLAHGLHEDLLSDSQYEFAPEYKTVEFDFEDADFEPEVEQDGSVYEFEVPYATEKVDRSLNLWAAAIDEVKKMRVNAIITEKDMRSKTTSNAQLTSPTENDPSQEFKTIEEWSEHYLNLPYSRLVRDRKDLLAYGGIEVEGETSVNVSNPIADRLSNLQDDDGGLTTPDPELVQSGSEMQEQLEAAEESSE